MEDGDSDAEMADYGTDFSDDVDPNVTRESGIGWIPRRFPGFGPQLLGGISRFPPIPDWPGIGNRKTGRFPIRLGPGIGVPGAARRGFPGLRA